MSTTPWDFSSQPIIIISSCGLGSDSLDLGAFCSWPGAPLLRCGLPLIVRRHRREVLSWLSYLDLEPFSFLYFSEASVSSPHTCGHLRARHCEWLYAHLISLLRESA